MTEREKVIKGLECCAHVVPRCLECPLKDQKRTFYSGKGCDCHSILADKALAILAEPEARVMEPEELDALAMDESDNVPVWYEYRIITDRGVITRLEASVLWWVEDGWWRRLGPVRMGWEDVRADGYGVSWRVWTERPTEAQREEMAWKS